MMIDDMTRAKEKIENLYSSDPKTKERIQSYIGGITVDSDSGGFLSCKINDEGKIIVINENDATVPVSKLSRDELLGLWVDFVNLLEELGGN